MSKKVVTFFIMSVCSMYILNAQHSPLSIKPTDVLRITSVGTPSKTIWIDGEYRTAKYRFKSTAKIKFRKNEYLNVTNCSTGDFDIRISGNEIIDAKASTIHDFILTRIAGQPKGRESFRRLIENYTWYIVQDTLYIPTDYILDKSHFFIMKPIPGDVSFPIPYDYTTNELCITRDYLLKRGVDMYNKRKYLFRIEYVNGSNVNEFISDNFVIEYIPID